MKAFVQHQYKDSDKLVLQSLIPFVELNAKALFTQKVLYNDIVSDGDLTDVERNASYYQRRLDPKRLREIKKYIYNSILDEKENVAVSALFPTAMILAVEQEELPLIHDGITDIQFEKGQRLYIVDGQHRLMAMRQLYKELHNLFRSEQEQYILEYLNSYKFNCTILVNYDIWEQGQVFINVNFKQKPVNRSLYYDVYGAEYIESEDPKHLERNKIFLAHQLTRFMNENKISPFNNNIKMLGTGKGYVSQSFFVEALLPLFKDTGIWYFDPRSAATPYSVLDACKSELLNFYCVVADCFKKYWGADNNNKVNFICKTTGVGAFTRLMSVLHHQLDSSILSTLKATEPGKICKDYAEEIKKMLTPVVAKQDELFGPQSIFGNTGGKGIENTLFKEMTSLIRMAGLLKKEPPFSLRQLRFESVKSSISQNQLSYLAQQGIRGVEEDLYEYINNHLPSEVDALASHTRIDDIEDLTISNVLSSDDLTEITASGTFLCKVEMTFDSDDNNSMYSFFPGTFTFLYKKQSKEWTIVEEGTRIFINTDSYYK